MRPVDFGGLKVCFIAGTLAKGGAERQLYYMLRALRQNGGRPRVLCFKKGEYWEDAILELDVPVTCVGRSRLNRIRQIVRELRENPPDILQSAHFYTNAYTQIVARVLGIQEIGAVRCDLVSEVSSNHPWLRRLSLATLRAVAANSRAAIRSAGQFGLAPGSVSFLPNVVDTTVFQPIAKPSAPNIRILGAGRFTPQKRFDRFLRVVGRVKRTADCAVTAVIAGDGPLRPDLQRTAVELGFGPKDVQFAGPVEDMRSMYQSADVFLLTSAYEGTPNVVLEAMACALPVVSTRVGDVPDVITNAETGLLADPNDEDRLSDCLERLVHDPALRDRIGRAARQYVHSYHSVANLPGYLDSLYCGVLQRESASVAHHG
jgi:glycosyltransferase involved in cell wall biosynthesis